WRQAASKARGEKGQSARQRSFEYAGHGEAGSHRGGRVRQRLLRIERGLHCIFAERGLAGGRMGCGFHALGVQGPKLLNGVEDRRQLILVQRFFLWRERQAREGGDVPDLGQRELHRDSAAGVVRKMFKTARITAPLSWGGRAINASS